MCAVQFKFLKVWKTSSTVELQTNGDQTRQTKVCERSRCALWQCLPFCPNKFNIQLENQQVSHIWELSTRKSLVLLLDSLLVLLSTHVSALVCCFINADRVIERVLNVLYVLKSTVNIQQRYCYIAPKERKKWERVKPGFCLVSPLQTKCRHISCL